MAPSRRPDWLASTGGGGSPPGGGMRIRQVALGIAFAGADLGLARRRRSNSDRVLERRPFRDFRRGALRHGLSRPAERRFRRHPERPALFQGISGRRTRTTWPTPCCARASMSAATSRPASDPINQVYAGLTWHFPVYDRYLRRSELRRHHPRRPAGKPGRRSRPRLPLALPRKHRASASTSPSTGGSSPRPIIPRTPTSATTATPATAASPTPASMSAIASESLRLA